ncbi:hypothetical protein [Pedobacter sp. FW305-3-2-15-E-R2A2]|uniref:hypothetical protein n=1 Tax=Pedobacter sp. FW305-3-2-15-E-R2A2 TaxID=3140251 RepID=UPI003140BDDA
MLTGNFENKTNMQIMGDALDLAELQKTLYKVTSLVAGYKLEDSDLFLLLTHFSQKTESAWWAGSPGRNSVYGKAEVNYYSFETSPMEVLVLSSVLRELSPFLMINELDEVNIYLLEYLAKRAQSNMDQREVGTIKERIRQSMESSGIKRFIQDFRCYSNHTQEQSEEMSLQTMTGYLIPLIAGLFVRI